VCELLVAAYDVPRPFHQVAPIVVRLERLGLGGFGWGVAWLDDGAETVRTARGLHRFADEAREEPGLATRTSRRFMVHLRRPSRLSTIQLADTQPFLADGRVAWCHNGFLERAEDARATFDGRLHGQADSEVGWQFFLDRLSEGLDPRAALRSVDDAFGGRVNLAYLGADGELSVYARNDTNRLWRYTLDGGTVVSTSLHSDDASLFDLVVPRASGRERLDLGAALRIGEPTLSAAGAVG
jgi:predicted glutamine amidotransferase